MFVLGFAWFVAAGLFGPDFVPTSGCERQRCRTPAATPATPRHEESRLNSGPVRDLSQDERAGGHILRKHVGQTEEDLRRRPAARREYYRRLHLHRPLHRRAHSGRGDCAIAGSDSELAQPEGRHPNLVLEYDSDEAIGRTMNRGEVHSRPCTHALVVLKYAGPNHYYVLTSYPECR